MVVLTSTRTALKDHRTDDKYFGRDWLRSVARFIQGLKKAYGKRETHARNHTDCHFNLGAFRGAAPLVAQSRLGLCSDRRSRTYPLHRGHSSSSRPDLTEARVSIAYRSWRESTLLGASPPWLAPLSSFPTRSRVHSVFTLKKPSMSRAVPARPGNCSTPSALRLSRRMLS